jgi:hypothetical protein
MCASSAMMFAPACLCRIQYVVLSSSVVVDNSLTFDVGCACRPSLFTPHASAFGNARGATAREAGIPRDNGDIGPERRSIGYIILRLLDLSSPELIVSAAQDVQDSNARLRSFRMAEC